MSELRDLIEREAETYFEWPTADKTHVTTTSTKLFAEHIAGLVLAQAAAAEMITIGGDNSKRMQPELVEYIRGLARDTALLDSDCIMTHECDELGQEYKCERRGIDLRAAIAEAIARRGEVE